MFAGCADIDTIEAVGLAPLLEEFGPDCEDGGWPMIQENWQQDKFDWAVEVGELRAKYGLNLFLSSYVSMDEFNADRNLIYVRNDTNPNYESISQKSAMLTDMGTT